MIALPSQSISPLIYLDLWCGNGCQWLRVLNKNSSNNASWLIDGYSFSLFREYFTQIYTSPLHVKGCKIFLSIFGLKVTVQGGIFIVPYHLGLCCNERLPGIFVDLFKPGSPRGGSDVHVELILINADILEYIYRNSPKKHRRCDWCGVYLFSPIFQKKFLILGFSGVYFFPGITSSPSATAS